MNCKDFEQMIPLYLHNELRGKELETFIKHLVSCDSCKEELTIQYLITEGMHRLEDGNTLDVEKELSEKLGQSIHYLKVKKRLHIISTVFKIAGVIGTLMMLFNFLL